MRQMGPKRYIASSEILTTACMPHLLIDTLRLEYNYGQLADGILNAILQEMFYVLILNLLKCVPKGPFQNE